VLVHVLVVVLEDAHDYEDDYEYEYEG